MVQRGCDGQGTWYSRDVTVRVHGTEGTRAMVRDSGYMVQEGHDGQGIWCTGDLVTLSPVEHTLLCTHPGSL